MSVRNKSTEGGVMLFSGGASGADAYWSKAFSDCGVPVVSFSFAGHQIDPLVSGICASLSNIVKLNPDQLDRYWSEVDGVCKLLRRCPLSFQKSQYVKNLLLRDAWQVSEAHSVYAVASLDPSVPSLGIKGGTAYACELFTRHCTGDGLLPVFLFDQQSIPMRWLQLTRNGTRLQWIASTPPVPDGPFAAIGARDLTPAGKEAIAELAKRYADSVTKNDVVVSTPLLERGT